MTRHDGPDLPIACTLTTEQLAARQNDLLPGLLQRARGYQEIDNGVRAVFDSTSENLHAVVSVIEAERHCCQFFRFQLTLEPAHGPITLDVTGPPGTREFLASLSR